jgi:hypothetical protein
MSRIEVVASLGRSLNKRVRVRGRQLLTTPALGARMAMALQTP